MKQKKVQKKVLNATKKRFFGTQFRLYVEYNVTVKSLFSRSGVYYQKLYVEYNSLSVGASSMVGVYYQKLYVEYNLPVFALLVMKGVYYEKLYVVYNRNGIKDSGITAHYLPKLLVLYENGSLGLSSSSCIFLICSLIFVAFANALLRIPLRPTILLLYPPINASVCPNHSAEFVFLYSWFKFIRDSRIPSISHTTRCINGLPDNLFGP